MRSEGDVVKAREHYLNSKSPNLSFLLSHRFGWMNKYIDPAQGRGVEVGCGFGASRDFIKSRSLLLTDFGDYEWLDKKNVDALDTGLQDQAFDFVIACNMIHHVPYPLRFLHEMHRVLKPGGYLLVQEINASLCMRAVLRLMKHEGWSFDADVFNENEICTDPNDLWSANCAIPNLLFDDKDKFERTVPFFKIVETSYSEFFTFLNSGGVIAKAPHVPLPQTILATLRSVDLMLANTFPDLFALQRQVVLRNIT